jgi:putative redox protein
MADPKPPLKAELVWSGELRFTASSNGTSVVTDGNGAAGASPMQLMAIAVAGCMASDLVSILQKGRHPLTALRASVTAERLPEPPRRFTSVRLDFLVSGAVPDDAVRRAIDLSREKYCSAWNSIRTDVPLTTTYTIAP